MAASAPPIKVSVEEDDDKLLTTNTTENGLIDPLDDKDGGEEEKVISEPSPSSNIHTSQQQEPTEKDGVKDDNNDEEEWETDDDDGDEDDAEIEHSPSCQHQPQSAFVFHRNRNPNPDIPQAVVQVLSVEGKEDGEGGTDVDAVEVDDDDEAERAADLEFIKKGRVYLVGTAHFSQESKDDVIKTIGETQPDLVMVELCKSRVNVLTLDEDILLKEASSLTTEKIVAHIKQSGLIQGVMHMLLVSMSANITKQLGMAPGGEFRAALHAARQVGKCKLDLGDRPVEITLQRALASLSLWKKLRLFTHILLSHNTKISKEDVEKCKEKDMLEQLLSEMAGEFPELSRIFVHERDLFMAARLRTLLRQMSIVKRRQAPKDLGAEIEPVVIVGVVGMGHTPGIMENWTKFVDVPELIKVPPRSAMTYVVKYGLLGAFMGAGLTASYLAFRGTKWAYSAITSF